MTGGTAASFAAASIALVEGTDSFGVGFSSRGRFAAARSGRGALIPLLL
eukprot:CAMPEP_0171441348 /NCGR_PEP_ID=MMETSP0881-20121228/25139_1 /TAXON_ID=67004 /ORGANISM="Thalassiosira weissflogii, Strain CCMP1336" /LENGTH=48 /DNA_ID= /DNA_START= /DNA_END= /DNA_ORIENTATION=